MDTKSCKILENEILNEVPITQLEYNEILDYQQKILEMISSGEKSINILNSLCSFAEMLLPNSVASIMLLNEETGLMSVAAAPSISDAGHKALENLKPGSGGGSCGNAVFKNEPQFVKDTFKDDRWIDIRQVAVDFNLCSCWSMPIRDKNKKAIGSFALSSFEHRSPSLFHKKLLETAAFIVLNVLKNQSNERKIKLFNSAIENASQGIIVTNSKNQIIEVNKAFKKTYHLKEDEILGSNPKIIASGLHNKNLYKQMWLDLINRSKWSGEITNKTSTGKKVIQWVNITALHSHDKNEKDNYVAIYTDITELKKAQKKLTEMAYKDRLTGLFNKTKLEMILNSKTKKSLILLNLNNFSYINTAYGFEIGDKLLKKISSILKKEYSFDNIFRINSDEFALIFDGKVNLQEKISYLQNYFYDNEISIKDIQFNLSFSYGGAYGNKSILRNSALALKQAKENGKNSVHIFQEDSDSIGHNTRENFIASSHLLYLALNEDRVVPYFQGIKDNKTGLINKFECLVRIIKDGEVISPFAFLEAAKLSGMLSDITKVMIDKSFKEMSKNEFTFSINITEEDLNKGYLVDYLDKKSKQYNIKKNRIILEVLEGISANGKSFNVNQLNKLKQQGYNIAIDDFGSEYSNFERVLELDIDFLKIDAQYIKDIHKNKKSYEITRAIAFFAKNTGIPCIAEFVYNKDVQKIIYDLGIEFSQGYLFSEPTDKPIS